jgi:SNF2 family DNA or RNA helicase
MSGTPAPLDETDYWSQCNFIKPGIFGKNFYLFRNKFFHLTNGDSSIELRSPRDAAEWYRRGFKYKINPKMKDEFFSIMNTISHSADKKTCLDLPEKTYVNKYCYMDEEQSKQYRNMKTLMFAEIEKEQIVASLALTKTVLLREILLKK